VLNVCKIKYSSVRIKDDLGSWSTFYSAANSVPENSMLKRINAILTQGEIEKSKLKRINAI